jgi:hypothetical protein
MFSIHHSKTTRLTELHASSLSTPPRTSSEFMSTGGKGSRLGLGSVEPASFFASPTVLDVVEVIGLAEEVLGSVAEGGDPSMASDVQ